MTFGEFVQIGIVEFSADVLFWAFVFLLVCFLVAIFVSLVMLAFH